MTHSDDGFDAWQVELHGHRVIYRTAGSGPPVVLIHGMVNSSHHWRDVALRLADRYTVIAPDLIGHGDSATPRGDYSLGAHAAVIRDLVTAIGVDGATVVGHSLGGGVAMQFFWQFPQRVERLVLVSTGGLGREVSPLLRSAALPGASAALRVVAGRRSLAALGRVAAALDARGSRRGVYLRAVERALRPLERPGAREAFLQTLRSVIDLQGQHVSATDRLYCSDPCRHSSSGASATTRSPSGTGGRRTRRYRTADSRRCRERLTSRTSRIPRVWPTWCATS